ncbi:MAG: hypothetical protein LBC27_00475 [Spirochaetaceae bacterium]|jgi:hypothetical protein|nr:hypothetical protein [Spirochaetaceae bacterium]
MKKAMHASVLLLLIVTAGLSAGEFASANIEIKNIGQLSEDDFIVSCSNWQVVSMALLRKDGFTEVSSVYVLSDEVIQKVKAKLAGYTLSVGDVWDVRINNNRTGLEIFLRVVDTENIVWDFYAIRFNFA